MAATNDSIQRAWLDVRCSTMGSPQFDAKMRTFLVQFNQAFQTHRDPRFKTFFGKGTELIVTVCKCIISVAKVQLNRDETQSASDSRRAEDAYQMQLLRALCTLVDHTEFPGKEIAELTSTYEAVEDANVVSFLFMLHDSLLGAVFSPQRGDGDGVSVDATCLFTLLTILTCPQKSFVRRCVATATQHSYVRLMATTEAKCFACACSWSDQSGDLSRISKLAAGVLRCQVLYAQAYEHISDALDILEMASNSSGARGPSTARSFGALTTYVQLLESILCVRARIGFFSSETVSFSVASTLVLASEDSAREQPDAQRVELYHRLVEVLEKFTTTERRQSSTSPETSPSKRASGQSPKGLLQMVPGTLSKIQQRLASTFSAGDAGAGSKRGDCSISCSEPLVSLLTVFVSVRDSATAVMFGEAVFRLLLRRDVPFDLVKTCFHVCMDNVGVLDATRLTMVLDYLGSPNNFQPLAPLVRALAREFANGHITDGQCRLLVLDFATVFSTKSNANAALVLDERILPTCLQSLSPLLREPGDSAKFVTDKIAVLAKVIVQTPDAAHTLESQGVASILLDTMLLACQLKRPSVSVMLRDMFTNLVVKTGQFHSALVKAIAKCSECSPWTTDSSFLLATLVSTLQSGKFTKGAIDQNAIELCLSMVQGIDASAAPLADLRLLGGCLGLLLPHVCYSEVWAQFDACISSMALTEPLAQFLFDLCCGWFASPASCVACQNFFESGDVALLLATKTEVEGSWMSFGPYRVPSRPFLRLIHPIKTIVAWSQTESEVGSVDHLRTAMEFLLTSTDTKVPNAFLTDYIQKFGKTELLRCLHDITATALLPLFFGSSTSLSAVRERQDSWLAVLCPQHSARSSSKSSDFRYCARFGEAGGAGGTVSCAGEQWPSPNGYSVAMWVHWESLSMSDRDADRKTVLWQISWTAQHTSVAVSLTMHSKQRWLRFALQEGAEVRATDLPFIEEGRWVHITVCHQRAKLFGSQVKVFYDAVLVQRFNCSFPGNGLQAAVSAAAAGVLVPFGSGKDIVCTVGSTLERPNGAVLLSFISFELLNCALSPEDVSALFCAGTQCRANCGWESAMSSSDVSLMTPYLRDEALRDLQVRRDNHKLASVFDHECFTLQAPPGQSLLRLHVRSMSLVDAPMEHLRSNKNWAFVNCADTHSSLFLPHGNFSPPQVGMSNEVDALLSHGAIYEWLCWLEVIGTCATQTSTAATTKISEIRDVAQRFLQTLAAANKQSELSPSMWRRFVSRVIEEAVRHPEVYLWDEVSVRRLLSLGVRHVAVHPDVESPERAKSDQAPQAANNSVLYFTSVVEHVFFNWKVLGALPSAPQRAALNTLGQLVSSANPFHGINAVRFRAADFVNGFVCGLFREYVQPADLLRAVQCVTLVVQALWRKADFMSELLTVFPVSTSAGFFNLGSTLVVACPSHTALVCNALLRAIISVWDGLPLSDQLDFARVLSSILPSSWFATMTSASAHPVSASLATRLFVICYMQCESFRETYRGERMLFLADSLSHHAHQHDVLDVVFTAFRGSVWSMNGGAQQSFSTISTGAEEIVQSFLELLLFLAKRLAQLLLMRAEELEAACAPLVDVRSYFAALEGSATEPCQERTLRPRLKKYAVLARCVVLLQRKVRVATSAKPQGSSSATDLRATATVLLCGLLDWLSVKYKADRHLQKALYRSDDMVNAIDMLNWPLVCTLDPDSVKQDGQTDTRVTEEASQLLEDVISPLALSGVRQKSEALEDSWEFLERDADGDDDDEDWEMLPVVISGNSRSYGLDRLCPRSGTELLYDACRSLYLVHAAERVADGDEFALPRGRVRMCKFVLGLHRALSGDPRGIGNQVEDCRAAFLCSVWMKAAEQAVDVLAASSSSSSSSAVKNVLSLEEYLLCRLVSGAAVPPLALSNLCRFMLTRLERNTEAVRRSNTCLFEWFMYITDNAYYKCNSTRAAAVVELLSPNAEVLFARPVPAGDLLRIMALRLLELTYTCLGADGGSTLSASTQDVSSPGPLATNMAGAAAGAPVLRKLVTIWSLFVNANREASVLLSVLQVPGKVDLWTGGFNTLLQFPSSQKTVSEFAVWLGENKSVLWRCFQGVTNSPFVYSVAQGAQYVKIMAKTSHMFHRRSNDLARYLAECRKRNESGWARFLSTTSFVDPLIIDHGGYTFPSSCVVGTSSDGALGYANEQQQWFLHPSGAVGVKELYAHENVDDLSSEPISLYLRYPPPVCMHTRLSHSDTVSPCCGLRWNALSLLKKFTGSVRGSEVRWIGNVYYVVGNDSRVCTLTVTETEVILISCSEVTKDGDFFIAKIRPQVARQSSGIKATLMQSAWRRLLTTAGGVGGGGAGGGQYSGTATNSKAAFRYSQYYRQLRTEALAGADALVWRFPLGQVDSVHQRLFQHMPAALEFIMETGERYLVVVLDEELSFSKSTRDKLQSVVADLAPRAVVETMGSKRSALTVMTRRWAGGEVTNYDYLMALNDAASRSVADIGQYPVMPWVLRDYRSDSLDLSTDAIYRDLTRPVGALTLSKAEQLQSRFRDWVNEHDAPFHYGTHYSSGAIVLYYLIRLQPFTARSISYQGGRLDIADRLFHSIPEAWNNSSGPGTGDVKELIPEFFRQGGFLLNKNHTAFGLRRDGSTVNDVILPPWSQDKPHVFSHINGLALESEQATSHLSDWIDLVFGFKQSGEAAINAVNVFHSLSYQDGVEHAINNATSEEDRKAIVASADNFGQTPVQLFTKSAHPRRSPTATSRQQYLLANLQTVQMSPLLPEGKLTSAEPGAAFTRVVEVDNVLFGCPTAFFLTTSRPTEVFMYSDLTGSVTSSLSATVHPNSSLPPIESLGCGAFTCMCVSARGSVLCVGTTVGKVIVFTRDGISQGFTTNSILHSSSDASDGVGSVQLFPEGRLLVTHESSSSVTCWHVSPFGSMFCYKIVLPPCDGDCSPVLQVARDDQRNIYYAVRQKTIVLFTGGGIVLHQFGITAFMDALLSGIVPTNPNPCWHVTAVAFCNCSSFFVENLLALGHANGFLTFWAVRALTYSDSQMTPQLYTVRFVHSVSCSCSVSSILLLRTGGIIVAGLQNGTLSQFSFPQTDIEELSNYA